MEKIDKTSSDKSPYFKRNICFDLDYIQADNFIRQYVEHFYDITESPNEFLLTAIITALGALIGNKAYIDTGIKRIFPNIWAVILGKTTALRKSTSIGLARGLLKEIGWDHFLPQIIHENTLIEHLELNPSGLMIFDEWKSFKSKISSRRGQSFKAMLTELYDSYEYKKIIKNSRSSEKKYQENKLENISLSLLAASTLDWFQFDKADIMSGFLPRFLFCTIEQSYKEPIPFPKKKAREKLIKKLSEIKRYLKDKQPISLDLSPKAKNRYKKWYRINYDLAAKEDNPLLPGFYRRMEQYILKFSIILHCTGNEFKSKKISAESMQSALKLAKYY
ncbi:MAG: DUF3987 domain-containing protein, partial [Candidatus Cloacimonetes bacterium]|nr:DUF3987 domain-containing protein [Candidatus Cloacimonadota bacterium]